MNSRRERPILNWFAGRMCRNGKPALNFDR